MLVMAVCMERGQFDGCNLGDDLTGRTVVYNHTQEDLKGDGNVS